VSTTTCGWCGRQKADIVLPHVRICFNCRRDRQYHLQTCPSCGEARPLGYLDEDGVTVCSACAGYGGDPSVFACTECGREDQPYGYRRCARCFLAERLTILLTDPLTGRIHEQLAPVYQVLLGGERPQNAIYWLKRRQRIGPGLLAAMARGEIAISHETFRTRPMDRTHNYLRDLLVAVGVLPPYEPLIERMFPLLASLTEPLDTHHSRCLDQYARWKVLRHLHRRADAGQLTKGSFQNARQRLRRAAALLGWLASRGHTIETATQADLEDFLATGPKSMAAELAAFLTWARETGLNPTLSAAYRSATEPQVTMSEDARWAHVNTLLHEESIRLYTRIGGLFMLLFAQPVADICRMRTDQVDTSDPHRVVVSFDRTPIEMPDPLAELIRTHLGRRGQASYASRDNGWLFPGGIPGRPLATENMRGQLVARGIRPHSARHAAMFALSAQVPHMILAQALGISHTAATRWAALAARDWGPYISQRSE
jgi:hypothetical protein